MRGDRLLHASDRWFRLLLRLYPVDFRDEMGDALLETYRDRGREALNRGGIIRLLGVWMTALVDALCNGPGERVRPAVSWRRSANWGRDLELATRRLVRAPLFVVAVVGTLTLGLGAFAVVYTMVQKILIAPLPYKHPDDLYFVFRDYGSSFDLKRTMLGGPDIAELQQAGGVIEDVVGLAPRRRTLSIKADTDPMEIGIMLTSPNLFEVLGVEPALGRGFAPSEVGPGRAPVIVLTHELWNRFGADPAIVGTEVRLNEEPYTVIGVMPPTFAFGAHTSFGPPLGADAYTTFDVNLAAENPGYTIYGGLLRARPGTTPQVVAAAVDAVGRIVDERDFQRRGLRLFPVGPKPDLIANVRPALVVLGFAGAFLVLVLMMNLGSLLLARAAQRENEFAVSRALGANGVAVARATLFEGGLLGLLGGTAGTLAAIWGTRVLMGLAPLDLPRREAVAVDWGIGAVVIGIGALLGLLAATAPAIWAARASLSSLLASSAVRGGGGHGRLRRGMVAAQVALTLVLLSAGGLVVRSVERLLRADPGFRPDRVLTVRVPMPSDLFLDAAKPGDAPQVPGDRTRVRDANHFLALQDRVADALAAVPGVTSVSATSALPLTGSAFLTQFSIPGAPGNTGDPKRDTLAIDFIGTRAGYVEVMGMRVLAGRPFDHVRRDNVREALIDDHLARRFFPTGSPLGVTIPFGGKSLTIVGVVKQARMYDVHQDGRSQLFIRAGDWADLFPGGPFRSLSFVMRTKGEPHTVIPDVRRVIRRVDRRLALADMRAMDEIVSDSLRQQRMSAVLIAGFALGGLVLAAMGLFSVVSGSVTRRRHELAVRMALGADRRRVLRLVLGEGAFLVGLGVLIGVPGIYATSGLIRGILVGVSPSDPVTLLVVALGLTLVTMVACYLPARRVLRIDPAQALRYE